MKVCEIKVNYLYTTIENKPKSYREKSDSTSKRGLVEKSKMIKSSSNNDLGRNLDSQSFLHRTYGVNKSYWPLSFEQLWIQRNWD